MYSFKSRIRYSEVNERKTLDLSSVINYFQDCSTFHSEDTGNGIDYLTSQNRVWLLNSWQIIVYRYPVLFETIKVSTNPYSFKSMFGYRNFMIQDENDAVCVVADSKWIYLNSDTLRPVRVAESDIASYGLGEKIPMDYKQGNIILPEQRVSKEPFPVVPANIDTNHHVNNGQYIKMAENYLPDQFSIRQMRAEYRSAATLGDVIYPEVALTDTSCTVCLASENKKPYAIIEFIS
ncbi:acyl-[acyl-carrier-protein] thioesterase [Anaeromicropila populeti]|uniref:Acyl-ACP thioesterase n=1 Tax=Anaeromicropila populeti TaxID=37658 RepID=A0A1I6J2U4_9FIRM|nr:acyl-ACP thioesterase domain-containing protein [Anaeromicropila populeti]SFR73335.1 Acyl-ACP thioesterase [Anaeromicropila populeti]